MARLPTDRTLVAPRISRAVGAHTSPDRGIDADQPGQWLELTLDMSTTTREAATTHLRLAVQVSPDGVAAYVDDAAVTFVGHPIGTSPSGAPEDIPGVQVNLARYQGRFIRAQLTVFNQSTDVGVFLRAIGA